MPVKQQRWLRILVINGWSADLFTLDKAGSKRNQMLRVVEAEEC